MTEAEYEAAVIDLDRSIEGARAEMARLDAELLAMQQTFYERVAIERERHRERLRDIEEQAYWDRKPLEQQRAAIARTVVDVISIQAPNPRIIVETKS